MRRYHLDTHALVRLHYKPKRLPQSVHRLLSGRHAVAVSPIVRLELYVLHEIGRLRRDPESIFDQTARATGLTVSSASLASVVSHATSLSWTRDPFDRLIVANAMADGCKLLTADEHIRTHFADAIW